MAKKILCIVWLEFESKNGHNKGNNIESVHLHFGALVDVSHTEKLTYFFFVASFSREESIVSARVCVCRSFFWQRNIRM